LVENENAVHERFLRIGERVIAHRGAREVGGGRKEAQRALDKKTFATARRPFRRYRDRSLEKAADNGKENELRITLLASDAQPFQIGGKLGENVCLARQIRAVVPRLGTLFGILLGGDDGPRYRRHQGDLPALAEMLRVLKIEV